MAHGGYHAPKYFAENFQGSNVNFDTIKRQLYAAIGDCTGRSEREIAQRIKEYCKENEIKLKTNKQDSSNRSTYYTGSSSAGGNVNITVNENKGLSFWDYLLLQNLFCNRQQQPAQPIIIHTTSAPVASYSAAPQEKKDESGKGKVNVFLFLAAPCVITHLAVCAVYHMHFKKEAEKSGKPIDYLANRQFGIALFQLAFGLASLIGGVACINQSEIFFPLLINTFICLGSASLFYHERNNTLKAEVEPYLKLAGLFINDERRENLNRQRTDFTKNFDHPSAPHNEQHQSFSYGGPPPPYSPQASAPAYPDLSTQFSNPNVTGFRGTSKN